MLVVLVCSVTARADTNITAMGLVDPRLWQIRLSSSMYQSFKVSSLFGADWFMPAMAFKNISEPVSAVHGWMGVCVRACVRACVC